jgi:hypothetical protein
MNLRLTLRLVLPACGMFVAAQVYAQPSGFSPEMIFDRVDQNGDGFASPDELSQSRIGQFAPQMGIDISRGVSRDQFSRDFERIRRERESSGAPMLGRGDRGGFGGGDRGGFGGGDRGGFGGGDRGDFNREDREDDRGDFRREGSSGSPGQSTSSSTSPATSSTSRTPLRTTVTPAPRVNIDLQSEFVAGDSDHDGQIGLYEWIRWKSRAALGEFVTIDRNKDGFLTPRELVDAKTAEPVDLASVLPIAPEAVGSPATTMVAATSSPAASPVPARSTPSSGSTSPEVVTPAADPVAATPVSITEVDEKTLKLAERFFSLLDTDHSGSIEELEWRNSSRLKPKFESAGIDLTKPMSNTDFIGYYARLFATQASAS